MSIRYSNLKLDRHYPEEEKQNERPLNQSIVGIDIKSSLRAIALSPDRKLLMIGGREGNFISFKFLVLKVL